jgi:hypothetical protein
MLAPLFWACDKAACHGRSALTEQNHSSYRKKAKKDREREKKGVGSTIHFKSILLIA